MPPSLPFPLAGIVYDDIAKTIGRQSASVTVTHVESGGTDVISTDAGGGWETDILNITGSYSASDTITVDASFSGVDAAQLSYTVVIADLGKIDFESVLNISTQYVISDQQIAVTAGVSYTAQALVRNEGTNKSSIQIEWSDATTSDFAQPDASATAFQLVTLVATAPAGVTWAKIRFFPGNQTAYIDNIHFFASSDSGTPEYIAITNSGNSYTRPETIVITGVDGTINSVRRRTRNISLWNEDEADNVFRLGRSTADIDVTFDDSTSGDVFGADSGSANTIGQRFRPSKTNMIKVRFKAKKTGSPSSLNINLYEWDTDVATTIAGSSLGEAVITAAEVDTGDFFDVWGELSASSLDTGTDHFLHVALAAVGDASNKYEFRYIAQDLLTTANHNWFIATSEQSAEELSFTTYYENPVDVELLHDQVITVNNDNSGTLSVPLVEGDSDDDDKNESASASYDAGDNRWEFSNSSSDNVVWKIETPYPGKSWEIDAITVGVASGVLKLEVSTDNSTYKLIKVFSAGATITDDIALGSTLDNQTTVYVRITTTAASATNFVSLLTVKSDTLDTSSASFPRLLVGANVLRVDYDSLASQKSQIAVTWRERSVLTT